MSNTGNGGNIRKNISLLIFSLAILIAFLAFFASFFFEGSSEEAQPSETVVEETVQPSASPATEPSREPAPQPSETSQPTGTASVSAVADDEEVLPSEEVPAPPTMNIGAVVITQEISRPSVPTPTAPEVFNFITEITYDEPVVKEFWRSESTLSAAGLDIAIRSTENQIVAEIPAGVSDEEARAFIESWMSANNLDLEYSVENGYVTIFHNASTEDEGNALIASIGTYIEEYGKEEEPETVVAEEEPQIERFSQSRFAFSLLLRANVAGSFSDSFAFDSLLFGEVGLGFDFSNIITVNDHVGFGLRSDLVLDFAPKLGAWNESDPLKYFDVSIYAEQVSLDLKLMMYFGADIMDLYLGGGVGFAIGNPSGSPAVHPQYLNLGVFTLGNASFAMDWFASATAGVRFHIGPVFSIGAEVNYRYLVSSGKHMGSAGIVFGFTF